MQKKDAEWKKELSELAYAVCRLGHTEPAFSGKLLHNKAEGDYYCFCCDTLLFDSKAKFDSGSGWPSFDRVKAPNALLYKKDSSHGMKRTEILCAACHSHLGHVFDDGPTSTGQRYCVNSVALFFKPK